MKYSLGFLWEGSAADADNYSYKKASVDVLQQELLHAFRKKKTKNKSHVQTAMVNRSIAQLLWFCHCSVTALSHLTSFKPIL